MDSHGILWLKEYGCTDGPLHPVQMEASKKTGERPIESTTVIIMLCNKINQWIEHMSDTIILSTINRQGITDCIFSLLTCVNMCQVNPNKSFGGGSHFTIPCYKQCKTCSCLHDKLITLNKLRLSIRIHKG